MKHFTGKPNWPKERMDTFWRESLNVKPSLCGCDKNKCDGDMRQLYFDSFTFVKVL